VFRAFASSLLSVLLVLTLVWGGCISCEQYFMWSAAKGCCSPNGHCKTKSLPQQQTNRECKQIAFEHQKSLQVHVDLPVIAAVPSQPLILSVPVFAHWHGANSIEPSPPDRQTLYSTFLI
jgi:hypothetical protein